MFMTRTQPHDWPSPCGSLPFTSIGLVGDSHPQAVKHAQHTGHKLQPVMLLKAREFFCNRVTHRL
jgi:hypothetical protein